MVSWAIKNFGGTIPRTESRNLPPDNAEQATNCDLSSGVIEGLPTPVLIKDFSKFLPLPQRAYRFPSATSGQPDAWLPLPSPFSSVMRSPLANDTVQGGRIYWTNPDDGAYWNTYDRILDGNAGELAPYNLGVNQPDPANSSLTLGVFGGTDTTTNPQVARSY